MVGEGDADQFGCVLVGEGPLAQENAAEPVSFPETVSVPDIGAALAVAVLPPD